MRLDLLLCLVLITAGTASAAADPCTGFKWDVRRELALFGGPSLTLAAGKNARAAPGLRADRFYQLQLLPQAEVAFAATPGRSTATDGAYGGLAELELAGPGTYRVAVDAPLWIDVVGDGRLAATIDFQGQQSCDGPHKIVEFDLTGAKRFVLQLSGSAKSAVRLTVTPAPARKL